MKQLVYAHRTVCAARSQPKCNHVSSNDSWKFTIWNYIWPSIAAHRNFRYSRQCACVLRCVVVRIPYDDVIDAIACFKINRHSCSPCSCCGILTFRRFSTIGVNESISTTCVRKCIQQFNERMFSSQICYAHIWEFQLWAIQFAFLFSTSISYVNSK